MTTTNHFVIIADNHSKASLNDYLLGICSNFRIFLFFYDYIQIKKVKAITSADKLMAKFLS